MKTFLILISVWLCAGSVQSLKVPRFRRSVSESTRFHNEYDRSDPRGHRTSNNELVTSPESCVPGTRWKNDCNSCWCSQNGVAACTLMGCLHFDDSSNNALWTHINNRHTTFGQLASRNAIEVNGDKQLSTKSDRPKRSSSTGTRFQNSVPDNEKNCVHGTTWMKSCNRCRCFGGRAACTRMRCIESESNI